MRGQEVLQNLHQWLLKKSSSADKSKSTDRWRRRRVVRNFWNGGDSRGEMSDVRRLCKEKEVRLGGIWSLKLAERAPRIDTKQTCIVGIVLILFDRMERQIEGLQVR